ncbi:MAG TPA: UDP-N-acetylmuramate dehydrogenase, partial [Alphaproteobacteria bacterium]|nr:UDP-N-acetylmuramate dehydrogenase [Alphaproteobacteria bacterium]
MSQVGLTSRLPAVRGRYIPKAAMSGLTWFRAGGPADVLFMPADTDDLAEFLAQCPDDVPVMAVGVGSNLLVRDGGIEGVVVRLAGKSFAGITVNSTQLTAGAAVLDVAVAKAALDAGLTGLEFMRGIPGSVGGGLRMNAGAYGREFKDVLVSAAALDRKGRRYVLSNADMSFTYRQSSAPTDLIFVEAVFEGSPGDKEQIEARMTEITNARAQTQPIKSRTGGSTFKN